MFLIAHFEPKGSLNLSKCDIEQRTKYLMEKQEKVCPILLKFLLIIQLKIGSWLVSNFILI